MIELNHRERGEQKKCLTIILIPMKFPTRQKSRERERTEKMLLKQRRSGEMILKEAQIAFLLRWIVFLRLIMSTKLVSATKQNAQKEK